MKSETKKGTLMTEGSIVKNILFFAIPLILGNLLQQLYNTADSIIVGNFVGKNALAAVGSSTSVIYLLIAFSQGASVGAGVVVSQYLGAKKKKETEDAVHTALAISVILGVILTIGGVLFSRRLLLWMHTPEEVFDGAVLYLQIYSGGLLFNVLYNMAAGILNAGGNSKRSLIYLAYASVTNIILDLVLIRGFGMGVEGAAIATDISQVVSSVLATGYLMRVKADYRVSLRKIKIHRQMAGRIVKIGLPTGRILKPSIFRYAPNPATASAPNPFTLDCTRIFDREMTIFWIPVGSPIFTIRPAICLCIFIFLRETL